MYMTSLSRLGSTAAVLYLIAASSSTSAANLYWTPWVSEEAGGPASICTAWDEAAVGFGCDGRYCDNVQLLCQTLAFDTQLDPATDYWTDYFSEEHDNQRVCHNTTTAGLVSGIKCQGDYCDNISIECTKPVKYVNGTRFSVRGDKLRVD
jgi:hypothetical protein